MGAISPIGLSAPAYIASLRAGHSGVQRLTFTHPRMKSTVAAPCAFDPASALPAADVTRLPRLVPMALAAAREALAHAGLLHAAADLDLSRRIGVILGTGAGGIDFTLDQAHLGYAQDKRPSLWTITNATHGNLAGELSIRLGLRGPSLCISTGCASSSDALGLALDLLRSPRPGTPDALVVVGADAHIRWETLVGMELLGVISTRDHATPDADPPCDPAAASRPFDATRDGFVLGEGAWALVLERADPAAPDQPLLPRPASPTPIARLLGYGNTCDAYHRVRPDPDMAESVRAMNLALADARLTPDQIDVLHYHGTATPLNDAVETLAVKHVFGPHAPRLVGHSVKSMIGHPQGACGAAAAVATLGALAGLDGAAPFLPPTINLRSPDPACDLDYTPLAARPAAAARRVLINCLAFGAKNSALVLAACHR